MRKLNNIHSGEILKEKFLNPMEITAYRLSIETFIAQTRISGIITKKRRITADTALQLSKYLEQLPNSGWVYRMNLIWRKKILQKRMIKYQ